MTSAADMSRAHTKPRWRILQTQPALFLIQKKRWWWWEVMEVSIKIDTARLKMEALVEKENQPLQFPVVVEER